MWTSTEPRWTPTGAHARFKKYLHHGINRAKGNSATCRQVIIADPCTSTCVLNGYASALKISLRKGSLFFFSKIRMSGNFEKRGEFFLQKIRKFKKGLLF